MGTAGTLHISDILTNTTGSAFDVTYVVTATSGATCVGTVENIVITVDPEPVMVTPQAKTICSGDQVDYEILLSPVNLPVGTVFSWADPDGAGPATAEAGIAMAEDLR